MTTNTTVPIATYVGDGTTTTFTIPFQFKDTVSIVVEIAHLGARTTASVSSVTGAGSSVGGSVTLSSAPVSGATVAITRNTTAVQGVDFPAGQPIDTTALEGQLDRDTLALQDHDRRLSNTVHRADTSPSTSDLALPEPIAGRALKWNAAGDGLENGSADIDQVAASAQAAQTASEGARDTSIAARDQAQGYRLAANNDATAAAASATNATTSASSATTSATAAATSANAAQVAKIEWQGGWSSSTSYNLNDAVTHSGSSYICKLASTGNTPPNATYWDVLAGKGIDGQGAGTVTSVAPGAGFTSSTPITSAGTLDIDVGPGANQIVQRDATGGIPGISAGGGLQSMQVITATGTWNKPVGITKIKVTVIGGGGAGGGDSGGSYPGQGGGAGGVAIKFIDVASISSVSATIGGGAPGSHGAHGGNGRTSSFGSHCSATGGKGGRYGSYTYYITNSQDKGMGGIGAGGDINIRGGGGEHGQSVAGNSGYRVGGRGGANILAGNSPGRHNANGYDTGLSLSGSGAGGSGGYGGGPAIGSNGATGSIIIEEYS